MKLGKLSKDNTYDGGTTGHTRENTRKVHQLHIDTYATTCSKTFSIFDGETLMIFTP